MGLFQYKLISLSYNQLSFCKMMTQLRHQLRSEAVCVRDCSGILLLFLKQKIQRKARPDRFREGHALKT